MRASSPLILIASILVVVLTMSPTLLVAQPLADEDEPPVALEWGVPFVLSLEGDPERDWVGERCATNPTEELAACLVMREVQHMNCGNLYWLMFHVRHAGRTEGFIFYLGTPGCPALSFVPAGGFIEMSGGFSLTLLPPLTASGDPLAAALSTFRLRVQRIEEQGIDSGSAQPPSHPQPVFPHSTSPKSAAW